MRKDERTGIGLAIAIAVLGLLAVGYLSPWWSYEESTGRKTAPDGPHGGEMLEERADSDFYVDGWQGDAEPASVAAAKTSLQTIQISLIVAAGAMFLYVLGQVPGISRIITRPACMLLSSVAFVGLVTALVTGWVYLPESMAGKGVDGPHTALLLENGYIRTHLHIGWAAASLACVGAMANIMAAYSAGNANPSVIEEYRAVA